MEEEPKVIKEDEEQKEETSYQKKKKKQKEFSSFCENSIDEGLTYVINKSILKEFKGKITKEEVKISNFSEHFVATLMHYFPDLSIDHPLFLLGISSFVLSATITQKMAQGKEEKPVENPQLNETEYVDLENDEITTE